MMRKCASLSLMSALVSSLIFTPTTGALESKNFAPENEHSNAVVALRIGNSSEENCTGTAIAPHWVLTARHCVDEMGKPGGTVRVGQGENQRTVDIDEWMSAPQADIALIHTTESMGLGSYPELSEKEPHLDQKSTTYGWSVDGSGGTQRLPMAQGKIVGIEDFSLYDGKALLRVSLEPGAQIQAGDSGGPLFVEGKIAGVSSVSLSVSTDNTPEASTEGSNHEAFVAPIAEQHDWIENATASDEIPQDISTGEYAPFGAGVSIWLFFGGFVLLILIVVGGIYIIRSAKEE